MKGLKCIHAITKLDDYTLDVENLLGKAAEIIPQGFQFEQKCVCEIDYNGEICSTHSFQLNGQFLKSDKTLIDGTKLTITVCYRSSISEEEFSDFLDEERELIETIICQLASKIERINTRKNIEHQKQIFFKSYSLADIGTWMYDFENQELFWSEVVKKIHEVPDDFVPTLNNAVEFYKEGKDRAEILELVNKAIETKQPYFAELQIVTAKGKNVWIRTVGDVEEENGRVVRLFGTIQDIENQKKAELNLRKRERELNERNRFIEKVIHSLPIGIALNKISTGERQLMNNQFAEIYGWPEEELIDVETFFKKLHPNKEYRTKIKEQVLSDIESGDPERMKWDEIKVVTKTGEKRVVNAMNIPLFDQDLMISTVTNVTERIQARQKLELNEQRFKALVQEASDLVTVIDLKGRLKYVSPTSEVVLGIKSEDAADKDFFSFIHPDDQEIIMGDIKKLLFSKRYEIPPVRLRDVSGKWRWLSSVVTNMLNEPAVKGFVVNAHDVTDRINDQIRIKNSLEEKEILLSEIHHRVKNNLAIVSGILHLQALDEENEEVIDKLSDSISRVQAIATIHELLYQTRDFSKLAFSGILANLISGIEKTMKGTKEVKVMYPKVDYQLSMFQAIPAALILNEVITNAYKHAFKQVDGGNINVKSKLKGKMVRIVIEDDGVGMPESVRLSEASTMGMRIIDILAKQLEAEYSYNSPESGGTTFTIEFKRKMKKQGIE
ncbi:MAG: PAS domain S-box protein [Balneolaceae bacterium]|nr:MAG: PAS domain S-box protein [Balneolaceae bacterium]